MWTSAGACHRTRAARGVTRKPSPSSAAANSPFLLEAVAAAPIAHQLLLDRWKVKAHSQAADHIEVLERNGDRMERAKRAQNLEGWLALSGVADASEVGTQVDF